MPLFNSHFQLGLIGYPLGHSLSPKIHTAALQSCGLEGNYSLFPIHPDDKQSLKNLLARVRSGEIQGLNVTIPHKQNVIPYLDELTPTAEAIGAVNTIYLRGNNLIGDNTDAPGFITDLKRFLDDRPSSIPKGTQAVVHRPHLHRTICHEMLKHFKNRVQMSSMVLGSGGSARAVVYALLKDGWKVTIAARRIEQANELAKQFANVEVIEYNVQTFKLLNMELIINTTPVGMTPNIDGSPWPENLAFPARAAIYDLVYNPRETKLVRQACLQGLPAITGLGMLIEQAALSFETWTGHNLAREIILDSVNQMAH